MITRRNWRANVRTVALGHRLEAAGCPVTIWEALNTAHRRNEPLVQWVKASLAQGVMLHTAQAEHISHGHSLAQTARETLGGRELYLEQVLYQLTRFEEEEPVVVNFYSATV